MGVSVVTTVISVTTILVATTVFGIAAALAVRSGTVLVGHLGGFGLL